MQGFDDRAAQAWIPCPRLCFVGSADEIRYGQQWGDVFVSLAGPIVREQAHLEALGWDVRVLDLGESISHSAMRKENAEESLKLDNVI